MKTLRLPGDARGLSAFAGTAGVVQSTIQFGGVTVEVSEVGVGFARTGIPSLIRASAETGRAFHIRNGKNPAAATALLVSPAALEKLVFAPVRRRTLGEVLDSLPFKQTGAPRLRTFVADNALRALRVPDMAGSAEP